MTQPGTIAEMTNTEQALTRAKVSATLRTVAEWGLAFDDSSIGQARDEFLAIADAVDRLESDDGICPVCQEVICDEGCPLKGMRS